MSVQVENLEKSMAKLTIEVSAEDLDKAMEKAYRKHTTDRKTESVFLDSVKVKCQETW